MQQVNALGLRLGTSIGWKSSEFNKTSSAISWQVNNSVRKELAKIGAFTINSYIYYHRHVSFCVAVYYRYLQRGWMSGWIAKWLRAREGVLSPPKTRYFIINKLDIEHRKSRVSQEHTIKRLFPEPGLKGYSKIARLSWKMRGWVDLELLWLWPMEFVEKNLMWKFRKFTGEWLQRSEFRAYNIFNFIKGVNVLKAMRKYELKRFQKVLFSVDILSIIYMATQLNLSRLLAHSIVMGLERHARKREQRRYLGMVRIMFEEIMMWESVKNRQLWRISIFGKLDAKMRRTHRKMRIGFIRYQELDFLIDYSSLVAKTKFGTTSVRIWMRNMLN